MNLELRELAAAVDKCGRDAEIEASQIDNVYIDGGGFISESVLYGAAKKMNEAADRATAIASQLRQLVESEESSKDEAVQRDLEEICDDIEDAADDLRGSASAVDSYHPDDGPAGVDDLQPGVDGLNAFYDKTREIVASLQKLSLTA